jgi:single-stranded DNA-specific DHH superfamily exonuclease
MSLAVLLKDNPQLLTKLDNIGATVELTQLLDKIHNDASFDWEAGFKEIITKYSKATASLRAPNNQGYHLPQIMNNFPELLIKFGGHPEAAGFTADSSNLSKIKSQFETQLQQINFANNQKDIIKYVPDDIYEQLSTNLKRLAQQPSTLYYNFNELNSQLLQQVFSLDPFGQDFPFPKFLFSLKRSDIIRHQVMGSDQNHIKLYFNNNISTTIFNLKEIEIQNIANYLQPNSQMQQKKVFILAKASQNVWNNTIKYELIGEYIEII